MLLSHSIDTSQLGNPQFSRNIDYTTFILIPQVRIYLYIYIDIYELITL